jgi:hypothetical protein
MIEHINGFGWLLQQCEDLQVADDTVGIVYWVHRTVRIQLLALYNKRGSILEVNERRTDDWVSHAPAGCMSTQSLAPSRNMSTV